MGVGWLYKGKALCDKCYEEETDFEIFEGKENEIPPKEKVFKKECDKCHIELEVEEEF